LAKERGTTWPIEPHTKAKHEILRRYWQAWLPIITKLGSRVLYIDGFAGPGRYEGGEDGSPLIVLKSARDHVARPDSEVVFVFIEKDEERFRYLNAVLDEVRPTLPENFKVYTNHGVFNDRMTGIFDQLDQQCAAMAPSLVFVDPFGFSHTPFQTIGRIMHYRHCEVLVTFMYEEINRFLNHPLHTETYDDLFGTDAWRRALDASDAATRRRTIHDIYRDQLRSVAGYVRSFEMLNRQNRTDYFLFFCTNELLGLERMKDSMWKVDPSGAYQFSDFTDAAGAMDLFPEGPDFAQLKALIVSRFKAEDIEVTKVGDFVVADTPFRRAHFKRQILTPMEVGGEISIASANPARKKGTFPPGTIVRFH